MNLVGWQENLKSPLDSHSSQLPEGFRASRLLAISLVWTQAQLAPWQHPTVEGSQPPLAFKRWLLCLREDRFRPKASPQSPPDSDFP